MPGGGLGLAALEDGARNVFGSTPSQHTNTGTELILAALREQNPIFHIEVLLPKHPSTTVLQREYGET